MQLPALRRDDPDRLRRRCRTDHPVVDLADGEPVLLQALAQRRCGEPGAGRLRRHLARERGKPLGIGWQGVGLPVLLELQPVLEIPQELIRRAEPRILPAGKQRLVPQPGEGEHRASVPDPRFAASVQPLQALHQELDVSDSARRQLHVDRLGRLREPPFSR